MTTELPICEAQLGWAYGCSRKGTMHSKDNLPCQDAYGIATGSIAGSPYVVAAVADGHGDAKHDLSQYGAALAVKAALDVLRAFYMEYGVGQPISLLSRNFKNHFPHRLGLRWRDAVLEDARSRLTDIPPSSAESNSLLWTRYGTTLLVSLIIPDAVLVGQIGDGDVVFVRTDGTVESPLKKDPALIGSATFSLCSPESETLWQKALLHQPAGGLLLMATDGLSDAFAGDNEQFQTFACRVLERINEYGMEKVAASIPKWLEEKYSKASGDDITLTLVKVEAASQSTPHASIQTDGISSPEQPTDAEPHHVS